MNEPKPILPQLNEFPAPAPSTDIRFDDELEQYIDAVVVTQHPSVIDAALIQRIRQLAWREISEASQPATEATKPIGYHGPYILLEHLRSGGMGDVYRAQHTQLKQQVALKVLTGDRAVVDQARQRFQREMQLLAAIKHPHVVPVFNSGTSDDSLFFAMELVDGYDLKLVARNVRLWPAVCYELVRQTALGLQAIHSKNIIHRDIKPSNLMLNREGKVIIIDFGLARDFNDDSDLTGQKAVLGTQTYMSPEQLRGERDIDHRSDLYSLGRTLEHLLARCVDPANANSSRRCDTSGLPKPISKMLCDLLAPNPENRVSSAGEVAAILAPYCKQVDTKQLIHQLESQRDPHSTNQQPTVGHGWKSRHPGLRIAALAIFCFIGGMLVSAWWFHRDRFIVGSDTSVSGVELGGRADAPSTDPGMIDPERSVARWVLEQGGRVTLYLPELGQEMIVSANLDLPQTPFAVSGIYLGTQNVSIHELAAIGRLNSLHYLEFSTVDATDETFADVLDPSWDLKWLYLHGSDARCPGITDNLVVHLRAYLHSLASLGLSGTEVGDATIETLVSFPLLRELRVNQSRITDGALAVLPRFPTLVALDISGTSITASGLTNLLSCQHLKKLKIRDIELSDPVWDILDQLKLSELTISQQTVLLDRLQRFRAAHPDCAVLH